MRSVFLLFCLLSIVSQSHAQSDTELSLEVAIDNPTPYIGEVVLYTVSFSGAVDFDELQLIEPGFIGLGRSAQILPIQANSELVSGVISTTATQSFLLYPLRTGIIEIEPYQIAAPQTAFQATQTVLSNPIQLNVQPLPSGAPGSFTNGIGQFEIEASTMPRAIRIGEAFAFELLVSGSGNIERLRPPELPFPENWQIFEQPGRLQRDSLRLSTRTFSWSVIPTGQGSLEIPSIEFSYLEPLSGSYRTRRTTPLTLSLTENIEPNGTVLDPTSEIVPALPPAQAPPLRTISVSNQPAPSLPNAPFWLLWLIAPGITLLSWLLRPQSAQNTQTHFKPNSASAAKLPSQASLHTPHETYNAIHSALLAYLSKKIGEPISLDTAEAQLGHLPPKLRIALLTCLQDAAMGAYAPITKADADKLLQRTKKTLAAADKVQWQ